MLELAIIGVRTNKHPAPLIVDDHFIQIAVRGPTYGTGMDGFRRIKRMIVKIQTDHLAIRRQGINRVLSTCPKQLVRGHFQLWIIKLGDRGRVHHIAPLDLDRSGMGT